MDPGENRAQPATPDGELRYAPPALRLPPLFELASRLLRLAKPQAVVLVFILFACGGLANAASDSSASRPRYSVTPIPGEPKGVWLLDTFTGSLSRCEFQDLKTVPVCSPWAAAPGEEARYRYDPQTDQFVPMNEAARQKAVRESPPAH